jgi:uncharacterized membrane protein YphA (DoxX/SURF4 family)
MSTSIEATKTPAWMYWSSWVITVLLALMLTFSATMKFLYPTMMADQWVGKFGYPKDLALIIGIIEISCLIVFLIPRTATLGAVLLTGYLGGAIATHVRVHDNFIPPMIGGILVWLALYLRDPRVRALLPLCQPLTPGKS